MEDILKKYAKYMPTRMRRKLGTRNYMKHIGEYPYTRVDTCRKYNEREQKQYKISCSRMAQSEHLHRHNQAVANLCMDQVSKERKDIGIIRFYRTDFIL